MSGSVLLLMAIAVGGAAVLYLLLRASPRLTFVIWASVLFFVPVWVGASIGFFWAAATLITLAALAASWADVRLTVVDAAVAMFIITAVAMFALKMTSLSATVIALLEWMLPFIWGRLVLARLGRDFVTSVIATVATIAAVLALIEFATATNVFLLFPALSPSLFAEWGTLQIRAGMLRAEGAWGHSIALGAALAMSAPFVMAVRWPVSIRLAALGVLIGASLVTFSRIGLLTLAISLTLGLVMLAGIPASLRWSVLGAGGVAAVAIIPFVGGVFLEAGDEAGGSADYRGNLFVLVSQIRLFGDAGDWSGLTVGGHYLGAYAQSIDNAFLVFALRFGWVPSVLLMAALVLASLYALRRSEASPPAIAVIAQLPALFAVALITQAGMYLWFLAGLAVAWRQVALDDARRTYAIDAQESWGARRTMSLTKPLSIAASRR